MQIQRESPENHTIRSYTETQITVGTQNYQDSVLICKNTIIFPWEIHSIQDLNEHHLTPILELKPDILLIGHQAVGTLPPLPMLQFLSQLRLGLECMSIGAAGRTFNVLLSEDRQVVVGFIF